MLRAMADANDTFGAVARTASGYRDTTPAKWQKLIAQSASIANELLHQFWDSLKKYNPRDAESVQSLRSLTGRILARKMAWEAKDLKLQQVAAQAQAQPAVDDLRQLLDLSQRPLAKALLAYQAKLNTDTLPPPVASVKEGQRKQKKGGKKRRPAGGDVVDLTGDGKRPRR